MGKRKKTLGALAAAAVLLSLAGCGDTVVRYPLAANVVSTQTRDGDVTRDPIDNVSLGPPVYADRFGNVLAGMEVDVDPGTGAETLLAETRGFLRFSLGTIPFDADVRYASLSVLVNSVSPVPADLYAEIPFRVELIDTGLYPTPFISSDFTVSPLLYRSTFFRGDDAGAFVEIDITALVRAAIAAGLTEFEVRLTFDKARYDSDLSTIARRVEIDDAADTAGHRRIDYAPLLYVEYD